MPMKNRNYSFIIVESFIPVDLNSRHGDVHIRPIEEIGRASWRERVYI